MSEIAGHRSMQAGQIYLAMVAELSNSDSQGITSAQIENTLTSTLIERLRLRDICSLVELLGNRFFHTPRTVIPGNLFAEPA